MRFKARVVAVSPLSFRAKEDDQRPEPARASTTPLTWRKGSGQRHASGGSAKGPFRNPADEIYEEPGEMDKTGSPHVRFEAEQPLQSKTRNVLPRGSRPLASQNEGAEKKLNPFEIYKNPPSQSRNAAYTQNTAARNVPSIEVEDAGVPTRDGKEIRSEDIRAATTLKLKDRSPEVANTDSGQ